MKAIEINGEIKTYSSIPNSFSVNGKYIAGGGKNLSEEKLKELGFKDVVTPDIDYRIQELSEIKLVGDIYTYDVIEKEITKTIEELKQQKIEQLNNITSSKLDAIQWYWDREQRTNGLKPVPQEIKDQDASIRLENDSIEAEINALTTKKSVVLFDINL